ncbi:MAG TPA: hypothetical protein DCS28_03690 [Candidatus Moranbacteria bacterium]|nr:hypothetical protein [Candidatus Moranbacteria bacterium]HAT75113.1 hypothetical protein [Candidatus Moranbacteria bacterium]
MRSLKSLLKIKLPDRLARKKLILDDKTVFYVFNKIIAEEFGLIGKQKFTPDYFSNKTLFVKAENSAWSSEIWINRGKIIAKINQEIGEEAVERIKMK